MEWLTWTETLVGVAALYDVMQWQAATGESHTFVLVDEPRKIAWVKYGAPERGGVMWVDPDELVAELEPHL
jgi:hypothetical protein